MRTWRPVISPTLAFEHEAVLKRHAEFAGLTLQDVDDLVSYLCSRSNLVQVYFNWRPMLRDPDDDRILEVAVRARAAIVTFNWKDFAGAGRFGVRVITPGALLSMIGGRS